MFSRYRLIHLLLPCAAICAAVLVGCASLGTPNPDRQSGTPNPNGRPDTQTWYLIYGEGAKPNRALYFAREEMQFEMSQPGIHRIELRIVYESAKQPDFISKTVGVNCKAKQYSEELSQAVYRNDRLIKNTQSGVHEMTAPWQLRVGAFACDTLADLTTANGFMAVGQVNPHQLIDLAWAVPWKDGTRPPYTTTKTLKEQAAEVAKLQEQANGLKKHNDELRQQVLGGYLQGAATPEERLKQDLAKTKSDTLAARSEAKRRSRTFNPILETWIGATEVQILSYWGSPNGMDTDTANQDRLLTYKYSDTTSALVTQSGQVLNTTTYTCTVTWRIRESVAVDYGWRGDCQSMQLKFGQGPHPENM
jgi:hypothetical protein